MKERLDQFINSNRSAFDDEPPPPHIWEQLNKNLSSEKPTAKIIRWQGRKVWAAAIVIAIMGTVTFLIVENKQLKNDLMASQQRLEKQQRQDYISADYNKAIDQFTQIVASKQNELSIIRAEYPSLYNSFTSDINDLNEEYIRLKEELKTVPEQDEVLDAMIQNLQLQAELLNEQLLIIQQLKSSKKNTNEKTSPVI